MKIRKNICVIIISLFAALCVSACDGTMLDITREALLNFKSCAGIAQWARSVTTGDEESCFRSVTVAPDGSVFAAGYIRWNYEYTFGEGVTVAGPVEGGENALLVKYSSDGTALWAKSVISASDASMFNSVTVGTDGSVYAAGRISGDGTFDFGNDVTVTGKYYYNDFVLVKFNSNGVAQWAKSVNSDTDNSVFESVTLGSDGYLYAAGTIDGTVQFDLGNGVTVQGGNSNENILLVKYSTDGTPLWAKSVITGPSYSFFYSVTTGKDGSVYAAGSIDSTGEFNFGNGVTAAGKFGKNIVLVKYGSDGTALWAKSVTTGPSYSYFNSVTTGEDGSVYAAGDIDGTGEFNFGNGVTAAGNNDSENIVLVKYRSDGTALWAKSVTTAPGNSIFYSLTADREGALYAAGHIDGTGEYDFGNGATVSVTNNYYSILLVKYNSAGTALWARSVTSGEYESLLESVAVHTDGSVHAAGSIYMTTDYDFGNGATVSGSNITKNVLLIQYR